MNNNQCRAMGCKETISIKLLMCRDHWRMVPKAVQHRVYRCLRYGPKEGYHQAVHDAIKAVNKEEQNRTFMGV